MECDLGMGLDLGLNLFNFAQPSNKEVLRDASMKFAYLSRLVILLFHGSQSNNKTS